MGGVYRVSFESKTTYVRDVDVRHTMVVVSIPTVVGVVFVVKLHHIQNSLVGLE